MKKNLKYFPFIIFLFTLISSCQKELNFNNPSGGSNGTAVFTLQGAPDTCAHAVVTGNYIKNIILTAANKVSISLNVTAVGTYNISTNTLNGYNFSATGSFSIIGLQSINLLASGTPLTDGINIFTVTVGSSSCTFSVTVTPAPVVIYGNHFPLTKNSYWTYDDLFNIGDTVKRTVIDSVLQNGNLYKIFEEQHMFGNPVQFLFRRDDSVYYEYGSVDKYTVSFKYLPPINSDLLFLKENLVTGSAWKSDEYIGPASFGQTIFFQYNFSCDDANATVILNGKTFTNVYKISMRPQIRSATTYPFNSTGELRVFYFAKDVGLIYTKATSQAFTLWELQIKNWHVN